MKTFFFQTVLGGAIVGVGLTEFNTILKAITITTLLVIYGLSNYVEGSHNSQVI